MSYNGRCQHAEPLSPWECQWLLACPTRNLPNLLPVARPSSASETRSPIQNHSTHSTRNPAHRVERVHRRRVPPDPRHLSGPSPNEALLGKGASGRHRGLDLSRMSLNLVRSTFPPRSRRHIHIRPAGDKDTALQSALGLPALPHLRHSKVRACNARDRTTPPTNSHLRAFTRIRARHTPRAIILPTTLLTLPITSFTLVLGPDLRVLRRIGMHRASRSPCMVTEAPRA